MLFDFNGTMSHDEELLFGIYAALFARPAVPRRAAYFGQLAGLTDAEMVATWLGPGHPAVGDLIRARVDRYCVAVADGATVPVDVRAAVRFAAGRCPVGVVSAAGRPRSKRVGRRGMLELVR